MKNDIRDAANQIKTLEMTAREDKWVNRLHPLLKLLLTVYYIMLTVSFHKYDLNGLLGMILYPPILFMLADLRFADALRRLRVVLPIVCIIGVFNPFFDRAFVSTIGGVSISGGVISMFTLMIKGVLTVLASYLLIATTTIEDICYALRLLHIPKIIVTEVLLIDRYILLLLGEANRMLMAYHLRSPGQKGIHYKAWGSFVGQLLLRSFDRADDVYESMCLRGFRGEFPGTAAKKIDAAGAGFFFGMIGLLTFLRLVPIMTVIGGWVI